MPCIPIPKLPLPQLPFPFSFSLPLPPIPPVNIAIPCCILPPLRIPQIPLPLPPLVVNPAVVTTIRTALAAAQAYLDALPLDCPRS